MSETKRGRGRPPVAPENRRDAEIRVRLTAAERATLDAALDGEPLSEWCRGVLLRAARRRR